MRASVERCRGWAILGLTALGLVGALLLQLGEHDGPHLGRAIMALELDLYALGVFEIVDDDLAALLRPHANRVTVSAETYS